jgi:hypothetical protein
MCRPVEEHALGGQGVGHGREEVSLEAERTTLDVRGAKLQRQATDLNPKKIREIFSVKFRFFINFFKYVYHFFVNFYIYFSESFYNFIRITYFIIFFGDFCTFIPYF